MNNKKRKRMKCYANNVKIHFQFFHIASVYIVANNSTLVVKVNIKVEKIKFFIGGATDVRKMININSL